MDELHEYLPFTNPQRRDRALHILIGLLRGISADGLVTEAERRELRDWLTMHRRLAEKCPAFGELVTATSLAIVDGVVTADEQADLLTLCTRLESHSEYYSGVTHVIQELHGMLHGIIADGVINEREAAFLTEWLSQFDGFRSVWPVTEIESILVDVLRDKTITRDEQDIMRAFFSQFAEISSDSPLAGKNLVAKQDLMIGGICAVDPDITFPGRTFCFTGISRRATRSECHEAVLQKGGSPKSTITNELDYLVVCPDANPCWAYSCYGRKVEEVMHRRRDDGQNILIVHEVDFWDALA